MAYVFSITTGKAQLNLDTLYLSNYPMAFRTIKDIVEHLASCFKVINEQADACNIYSQLRQAPQEYFRDFKIHFINTANWAQVN